MSTPSIPMPVLIEASNALALVRAIPDKQPVPFEVWTKVMSADIGLRAALAALAPVEVAGAAS